jgi:hypothetical protein
MAALSEAEGLPERSRSANVFSSFIKRFFPFFPDVFPMASSPAHAFFAA